mgnify:CR=1 FL=1
MDYKYKYLKYKKMYLSLKNKISQVGGAAVNTIDNIEEIREIYRQIPSSGMYHTNKKESKKNLELS